ncbi:hypothetical protein Vafri_13462 [Volvox africanus]|nr:hypothetical protein Vafri_13462 [Volvox africanus]
MKTGNAAQLQNLKSHPPTCCIASSFRCASSRSTVLSWFSCPANCASFFALNTRQATRASALAGCAVSGAAVAGAGAVVVTAPRAGSFVPSSSCCCNSVVSPTSSAACGGIPSRGSPEPHKGNPVEMPSMSPLLPMVLTELRGESNVKAVLHLSSTAGWGSCAKEVEGSGSCGSAEGSEGCAGATRDCPPSSTPARTRDAIFVV